MGMSNMFEGASSFQGDLLKWEVSNVRDMRLMFERARLFNSDISKWDVSSVTRMNRMFWNVESFDEELCGSAWVQTRATKKLMFEGSKGSLAETACEPASTGDS